MFSDWSREAQEDIRIDFYRKNVFLDRCLFFCKATSAEGKDFHSIYPLQVRKATCESFSGP